MRTRCAAPVLLLLILLPTTSFTGTPMINPVHLTCEYRVDPPGIDIRQPHLAWTLESTVRGAEQTGYRIIVASTPELLAANTGDLWDTGKRTGRTTASVRYEGRALQSHQCCYWKVMAWDHDTPGPWSAPAHWSMGILSEEEWRAEWIGYDAPRRNEKPQEFLTAQWIWFAGDPLLKAPAGTRYFARIFETTKPVSSAEIVITADDGFALFVNGTPAVSSPATLSDWKTPRRMEIGPMLLKGANVIAVEAENLSTGEAGLVAWLRIVFADGSSQTVVTDRSWRAADRPGPEWQTAGAATASWGEPATVANIGMPPWCVLDGSMLILPPPRHIGTGLMVHKPVRRATLYASALGLCDLYLNGRRVSEERFTPGWSDYAKRVYYRTYDVTTMLQNGANTLGAVLADGWFSGYIGWGMVRDHYGTKTRFRAHLRIEQTDGSILVVATGPDWKAWTGPTLEADFLMGETYDARLAGTSFPAVPAGDPVSVGSEFMPVVQAHPGPPVRAFTELAPRSITQVNPNTWIFDFGQNFAGVVRLRTRGPAGTKITLRFAERLDADGSLYTKNLRSARAIDTYICSGTGEEVWEPRFTFHGFQYVEVSGLTESPGTSTVTGIPVSSDTPPAGSFECSDPMVNRLHSNILWTQRANFIDVPTDCPQRDERLGWTGDAQAYIRSACLNTDAQAFYHKWITDLTDAQRADGQFPMVAPLKVAGDDGGPAWADAGVICPWTVYETYGDREILEQHYDAMARFVDFTKNRSTPDLLPPEKFHCFGDWLNINAETPHDVIFISYFARCTDLVARTADVLGKLDEAERYRKLFGEIRKAFQKSYVDAQGRVKGHTQTAYILALASGLLDGDGVRRAADHLVKDIESRGWRLSTGFVGTKDLMLVLSSIGRNDVAYRLLQNETFPSWGFTIRHGATSIWERWDGWTPEKGFQDPGMNSFAHYAFGAVYQWMVENIGGIRNEGAGFWKLVFAPQPGGTLTWASVGYRSVAGPVSSSWKISGGSMTVQVVVPVNATATVRLPGVAGKILESGLPAEQQKGVKILAPGVIETGSGSYEFVYPYRLQQGGR